MKPYLHRAASLLALLSALCLPPVAEAAPARDGGHRATAREAHALLSDAVTYLDRQGAEQAFRAFNDRQGKFVRRDLYVFVLDQQGVYRANGAAPDSLVGLNVLDTRDAAGTPLVRNMLDAVSKDSDARVNYVWLNRTTNKVEPKSTWLHRSGEYVLGVGYYAPRSDEASARQLLGNAATLVGQQGMTRAAKAFNNPKGRFVRDDLYVFAVNLDSGKFEAHGAHPQWTGTQATDLRDAEGHALISDMITLAKQQGEGSVDYVWRNPVTNAVEKKRTFIRQVGHSLLGVGFYRED